ncbi:hypothetical protein LP419_38300 [Massilia sp. H-1]|nr:hypothetical protein LP419_38300 [Massilia sp. H-1]
MGAALVDWEVWRARGGQRGGRGRGPDRGGLRLAVGAGAGAVFQPRPARLLVGAAAVDAAVHGGHRLGHAPLCHAGAISPGIPQVIAALDSAVTPHERGRFVSLRLSLAKMVLTAWGLLARPVAGPRRALGADCRIGIMLHADAYLPARKRALVSAHGMLVVGMARLAASRPPSIPRWPGSCSPSRSWPGPRKSAAAA